MDAWNALTGLLAVLCLFNLVLTYGVVRRLRALSRAGADSPATVSGRVDEFAVTAVDGTAVGRADLAPGTVLGFFSPGCPPCAALLPRFVGAVRTAGLPAAAVLAVVMPGEDPAEARKYARELAGVATVVVGEQARAVSAACGVQGFPAVCVIGADGRIREADGDLSALGRRPAGVA
ncbi:TlpA disulfide reductase family protein [Kitasatospora sp. NPDC057198]|uniref:TlpA disulfide reductase family protein n=1 Tax=Kitasatospora sp. NPDC057198 TaxID=3346046 RepID=UPI003636F2C8